MEIYGDRLLRIDQVLQYVPLSKSAVWERANNPDDPFPAPIKLSKKVTVWKWSAMQAFISSL
jgi:predicted DNA-binding transcriptional regulator AlpA